MTNTKQRAENTMIGLAIGDALSWTSIFHKSFQLPVWTRRIRREIDLSSENTNVIVTPMPFSLNQSAEFFKVSSADKTEWAAFSSEILLKKNFDSYENLLLGEWLELANSKDKVRGSISTQAALHNLRKGVYPPQSGRENPHYFDDGAMPRAVPIGIICSGQPDKAARLAEKDASVTNSEDGIFAAQAMAVAVSLLCSGKSITDSIGIAGQYLPESSWIKRIIDDAIELSEKSDSIFPILPEIQNKIVNREYSYGNVAPETLALTFIIALLHGDNFETAMTTSLGFAKSAETLPAMVGAVVGAMQLNSIASNNWLDAVRTLNGICIPKYAGKDYIKLVEELSSNTDHKVLL